LNLISELLAFDHGRVNTKLTKFTVLHCNSAVNFME
jgi:hypothetical protein